MFEFLRRRTPDRFNAQLLEEARLASAEHRAAAEHHAALASMYDKRIERLSADQKEQQ